MARSSKSSSSSASAGRARRSSGNSSAAVSKSAKSGRSAASAKSKSAASAKSKSTASAKSKKTTGGRSGSQTTIDHEEIRQWAEQRGGKPACVQGTGGKGDVGMLRIEFPGKPGAKDDKLQEIEWDEFFEKFDERNLAVVYQEKTAAGKPSNFNKLVNRASVKGTKTRAAG